MSLRPSTRSCYSSKFLLLGAAFFGLVGSSDAQVRAQSPGNLPVVTGNPSQIDQIPTQPLPLAPANAPAYPQSEQPPLPTVSQPAPAQPVVFTQGTEWEDSFDEGVNVGRQVNHLTPMMNIQTPFYLEQAIVRYQQIVQEGGWGQVPAVAKPMRMGRRNKGVLALRKRLMVSGDLSRNAGLSETFDSYVDAAVRRFQQRHGLFPDGVVGKGTIQALNVPAQKRLQQLYVNLDRARELAGSLPEKYVMVNVPGARIEAVENGLIQSRHTAVVGKRDRQTPILTSAIYELNFNPYWTVPVSIIRKDLIPRMQEDPSYLEKNRIRIFDWYGKELQWQEIDWNTEEATKYRFTQDPGDGNSLGSMRINFSNKFQVYLHDTPEQSLFGSGYRFHSSGCVRVQNVRVLATWLLKTTPDWNRQKVDDAISSGERLDVKLKDRVPLLLSYLTAWAQPDGAVHFREDIYERDAEAAVVADGSAAAIQ